MKLLSSIICLLFTVTLNAQTPQPKWNTQKDSVYNFTFQYPSDWDLKLPNTNTRFFVTSKQESETDLFRENINCVTRNLGKGQEGFKISMAEDAIKKALSEKLTNYVLTRSAYSKWNNAQMLEMEYTCTQEVNGKELDIHMLQKMAVVKGQLFTITYTAEADSYPKYIATVQKVIASLKVN
jgi:hypothetical protein